MHRLRLFACVLTASAAIAACLDVDWTPPRPLIASLLHVEDCDALLAALREDARSKVEEEARSLKASYRRSRIRFGFGSSATDAGGAPPPEAEGPSHYTDTNTQVAGVDEPDFVKTDGHRVFVVHGGNVEVFRSWPADETHLVGSIAVEGEPTSMFLAGERLVVFSQVAYSNQGGEQGSALPAELLAPDRAWGAYYPYAYRTFTKISVFDVSGESSALLHERYVEGHFRDARRHGPVIRTIVEAPTWQPNWWSGDFPPYGGGGMRKRAFFARVDDWRDARLAAIEKTELSDFLPDEYVVEDGVMVRREPRCDRYYAPPAAQSGYGMTAVVTLDLESLGEGESLFVLGSPNVIYASHDVLLLGHELWLPSWAGSGSDTALHAFSLDEASTEYLGSGAVPGYVRNQFSLDERDGIIRASTTETTGGSRLGWLGPDEPSANRVITYEVRDGALVELGRTPALAPGEQIFATRYLGDLAYVVTFRQVDPLFAIDLSDPKAPTVLGELKIPGFSTYLHPLSASHLLTIGRYVDERTGWDRGMQLQIFDVSDPSRPTQLHSLVVEGYSSAEHDHKAFVYDPVNALLAVPVDSWSMEFVSALRLFHVSIDEGFTEAGAIDHTPLFSDCVEPVAGGFYYVCGYGSSMRRGLFIDDYVYALSYGGLSVHALDDVSTPLVVEPLPPPVFYAMPWMPMGW